MTGYRVCGGCKSQSRGPFPVHLPAQRVDKIRGPGIAGAVLPQAPRPLAALSLPPTPTPVLHGSSLRPSLLPQKKSKVHYHVAVIINYLGHCVSLAALLVAFVLFLRLR